jgi:hypothetical protein
LAVDAWRAPRAQPSAKGDRNAIVDEREFGVRLIFHSCRYKVRTMDLAEISRRANDLASRSRRIGAPILSPASARGDVIAWLQWNDPNGSHTDELASHDDIEPYTLERAWQALAEMIEDA